MPELLIELFSEEIPARMQARAAEELKRLVTEKLAAEKLAFTSARAFVTPRRLVLVVDGLPERQPDLEEERKGPRIGADDRAIQGFLKAAGLTSLDQAQRRDTGKGEFWFAVSRKAGRSTKTILPGLIEGVAQAISWPKSMRWAGHRFRWVRPLHGVLALFGGKPLSGALDLGDGGRIKFSNTTRGHRFLAPKPLKVESFADYEAKLRAAFVMLDPEERKRRIAEQAAKSAAAEGLTVRPDPALLDEVAGLVEWPVVLMGRIDARFMQLPPEVLTATMRTNQKYFSLLDREGKLAPRFLVVANIEPKDGGKAIVAGNERVLRARLADAEFFWTQDRKQRLDARLPALGPIIFHAKLGTMADKVARVEALAGELASRIPGADPALVGRAATLAKADLVTGMVGEFPELQGTVGRYYALAEGERPDVAAAIAEHYSPVGPNDRCPTAPVSVAVALADKIDTLVGFFAIGETPTGSKDPFGLRRAALGVLRLIIENSLRVPLTELFRKANHLLAEQAGGTTTPAHFDPSPLLGFLADRLRVHLREKGVRHDLIAAVFALGGEDDIVRLLARVDALQRFLGGEDGANLLTAYRRAANILKIEEKKDGASYSGGPDASLLSAPEEKRLYDELTKRAETIEGALKDERFDEAMRSVAALRPFVDTFFDKVTVNADDPALRRNRLFLLATIRGTLDRVADFSRIEG